MCGSAESKYTACLILGARTIAIAIVVMLINFLVFHEKLPSLPEVLTEDIKAEAFKNMDSKIASADSLKALVDLYVTLSLGLTALVGFALKDGFGRRAIVEALETLLLSSFVYFLVRLYVYANETFGTIAIQIDSGHLFVSRLDRLFDALGLNLLLAAGFAMVVAILRLYFERRKNEQ